MFFGGQSQYSHRGFLGHDLWAVRNNRLAIKSRRRHPQIGCPITPWVNILGLGLITERWPIFGGVWAKMAYLGGRKAVNSKRGFPDATLHLKEILKASWETAKAQTVGARVGVGLGDLQSRHFF